ncbi:MAG: hypothetical protein KDA75_10090 [Planctomycetaceae bacterium]|nr:hypothetical protein [Planctomycetaceae bacterium]
MSAHSTRRRFLQRGLGVTALAGVGDLGFLRGVTPVAAADAKLPADTVYLRPEIEPVVRLIEETPRDRLLEEVAARIKQGLNYQEVLAGLLLAGVKNVEPRPSVGFKFHAVLVVNSAHLASLASRDEHRWLPIFWALDYYKTAAQRDVEERGDWTMSAVKESSLPSPDHAGKDFATAMNDWDESAADAAVAQLARTASANEVYEQFFRFGMRDFRSIGHKAIYVANSWRTLQCIGWQHAEPVVRSLAYALLMHEGGNPAQRDDEADRPFRRNQELAARIRPDWLNGRVDTAATEELLQTLRTGASDEACDLVVDLLNRGIAPQSIWDALHVSGGEYLMQQTGIVALHAVTTTNALRHAWEMTASDETRRLLMLQNAAFLPMFHAAMQSRGKLKDVEIAALRDGSQDQDTATGLESIFATLGSDRMTAAQQTLSYLQSAGGARDVIDAARVLVFLKGNDAHDYKFSSAVLEDYYLISPEWRDQYLAANVFNLHGSTERDNPLVERIRAALG